MAKIRQIRDTQIRQARLTNKKQFRKRLKLRSFFRVVEVLLLVAIAVKVYL